MNSIEFLDAVRERHNIPSYNKLAKFFGVHAGRISMYTTGKRTLEPKMCHKVASALDVDAGYVMSCIQAERAKRSEDRKVWTRVAKVMKSAAAVLLLVLGSVGLSGQTVEAASAEGTDNIHYTHKVRSG